MTNNEAEKRAITITVTHIKNMDLYIVASDDIPIMSIPRKLYDVYNHALKIVKHSIENPIVEGEGEGHA